MSRFYRQGSTYSSASCGIGGRAETSLRLCGVSGNGFAVVGNTPSCAISNHMASDEDLKAEIERLRAENEALKKPARGQMSLKVSEKGGLSVYGLG